MSLPHSSAPLLLSTDAKTFPFITTLGLRYRTRSKRLCKCVKALRRIRKNAALGSHVLGVAVGVPWIAAHVSCAFFVWGDALGVVVVPLFQRIVFGLVTLLAAPVGLPLYLAIREGRYERFTARYEDQQQHQQTKQK
eukprot:PhM_4_TR3369/c0_g1_i1/m.58608